MSYAGDKFSSGFHAGFAQGRAAEQIERARVAEATSPFKGNDPALLRAVRCRVLKPFFIGGKAVEVGAEITLAFADATSLAATKRVEILP